MLILQILSLEPAHGYGIAQRLEQISRAVVQVNQGSLYPALHRLEQKGWLKAEWKQSETGREAKFYSLTRAGRKQLGVEKDSWARLAAAVQLDLRRRQVGHEAHAELVPAADALESDLDRELRYHIDRRVERPDAVRPAGAGSATAGRRWSSAAWRRCRRKCATCG